MNNYFVARFEQVTNSESFTADKNGKLPFIGTPLAGVAKGTLINGTMFQRNGLTQGQMYLCENYVDAEYPDAQQVRIISPVGAVEFIALANQLGKGILVRPEASEELVETVDAIVDESIVETATAEDIV